MADRKNALAPRAVNALIDTYRRYLGDPFAAVAGGGVRGFLGLAPPEYGGDVARQAYQTGQAMGNMPGVGAPAGAFKAAAKFAPEAAMFIGAMAKTWDKASNARAVELEKAGVTPQKIWSETGNWRGPDGNWRQEIDDSTAKLLESKAAAEYLAGVGPAEYPVGAISNVLQHSELSAAYPSVMGIKTRLVKGESGAYLPNTGFGEGFNIPSVGTQSTTLHELQHAIQQREKFARGGTANEKNYRRLAGEAEARAVQARLNLTPAQRRALFPEESYDMPINQLIIKK